MSVAADTAGAASRDGQGAVTGDPAFRTYVHDNMKYEALQFTRTQRAVLERLVSELTDDPETRQNMVNTLAQVSGIEAFLAAGNVSSLNITDLLRFLRAEIAVEVANMTGRPTTSQRAEAAALAAASAASRHQVQSLMRDFHRFDPYLQFASAEDEVAYRSREAERRAYIEAQHTRGTPAGDLNAAGAAIGQMVDAQAHGAARSPEFPARFNELTESTERLRGQLQRSGESTREFDDRLRQDLRRAMRARGLTDQQIEARFAAHPDNPLAAVRDIGGNGHPAAPAMPATAPVQNIADAMAEFRAAGIVASDHMQGDSPAHGLAANDHPVSAPGRSAG